jgi:hypothetical protein
MKIDCTGFRITMNRKSDHSGLLLAISRASGRLGTINGLVGSYGARVGLPQAMPAGEYCILHKPPVLIGTIGANNLRIADNPPATPISRQIRTANDSRSKFCESHATSQEVQNSVNGIHEKY